MANATGVPDIEKRIVVAALLFSAAMLVLLAYAAVRLGISVPGCITNVKPFASGELIQVGWSQAAPIVGRVPPLLHRARAALPF